MYRDNLNVSLTLEDMDNLMMRRYAEEELSEKRKTYAHAEWYKRCIRVCILFVLLGISCALKGDLRHICMVIIAAFLLYENATPGSRLRIPVEVGGKKDEKHEKHRKKYR